MEGKKGDEISPDTSPSDAKAHPTSKESARRGMLCKSAYQETSSSEMYSSETSSLSDSEDSDEVFYRPNQLAKLKMITSKFNLVEESISLSNTQQRSEILNARHSDEEHVKRGILRKQNVPEPQKSHLSSNFDGECSKTDTISLDTSPSDAKAHPTSKEPARRGMLCKSQYQETSSSESYSSETSPLSDSEGSDEVFYRPNQLAKLKMFTSKSNIVEESISLSNTQQRSEILNARDSDEEHAKRGILRKQNVPEPQKSHLSSNSDGECSRTVIQDKKTIDHTFSSKENEDMSSGKSKDGDRYAAENCDEPAFKKMKIDYQKEDDEGAASTSGCQVPRKPKVEINTNSMFTFEERLQMLENNTSLPYVPRLLLTMKLQREFDTMVVAEDERARIQTRLFNLSTQFKCNSDDITLWE